MSAETNLSREDFYERFAMEATKSSNENLLETRAHARPVKILRRFLAQGTPSIDIERGILFTESMRQTEEQVLILRWAKAMYHVVENITIHIDEDQLIIGSGGGPGRYGILYPEVDGTFYEEIFGKSNSFAGNSAAPFTISNEEADLVSREIGGYWKGKTYLERYAQTLPEETFRLTYHGKEDLQTRFLITECASYQSSLQWTLDYEKVLRHGMKDIRRQAEEGLAKLDLLNPKDRAEKKPFYDAVLITCDALKLWTERHALKLEELAAVETNETRKKELLQLVDICRHVPENPARTFWEAVQCQWFLQLYSRFEAKTSTIISNGRMDQYLYPFYKADIEKGILDKDGALELLGCLWTNMARYLELHISVVGIEFSEGYAHWEAVCVGGQTTDGRDATNELTHLFFRSSREFPTHYPDLAARVHSLSPQSFLWDVAETIKAGAGFPKIINDEEVVVSLITRGATREQALDYTISGCTEVRMVNTDTYLVVGSYINYGSLLESVLYNGQIPFYNYEKLTPETGDVLSFDTWEKFWNALMKQHDFFFGQAFMQHYMANKLYHKCHAAPLSSALHDLCMANCKELHEPNIEGGLDFGYIDCIGFGTLVDSLSAIKKFVYEDKILTLEQIIEALKTNFDGAEGERIRLILNNSPAFGNNDSYADNIAYDLDTAGVKFMKKYNDAMGVQMSFRMVPVTSHVPFGKVVGATPNGRKAYMPLSDGASASHGRDLNGPTAVLLSNYETKNMAFKERTSRLLNIKFTPTCVDGDSGTEKLISFIRTLINLKLWHIQFNVVNRDTLLAAQKDPDSHRSLIVRIAGYSAYFCDLSTDLQNDLIHRTDCQTF